MPLSLPKNKLHKVILVVVGIIVSAMGVVLFFDPPILSSDLSQAFQVLRSMQLGAGFNNLVSVNTDDYIYKYVGHGGPLYIVLPSNYKGAKEKLILQGFPGYTNFNCEMLSHNYVLYTSR